MSDPGPGFRPEVETLPCADGRVMVVDAAGILAAAADRRVELLHDVTLPAPVSDAALSLTGTAGTYHLEARVRVGRGRSPGPWSDLPLLGNDPIGVLLSRRFAVGDAWARRVVDGMGTAVSELSRRLGAPASPPAEGETVGSEVREDPRCGLRATVTYRRSAGFAEPGYGVTVAAEVPAADASAAHFAALLEITLRALAELVGGGAADQLIRGRYVLSRYPTAPTTDRVTLDQVGGLDGVVAEFRQIASSFRHPQALARWGARRPQGLLLYGPPGTGKTMLARALANEIGAEFREIRTPEILDKWLGGSERNIKRIFREARHYRQPTVMLFDEFDSIISYTGAGMDAASQAINAVAGIFKQEMNSLIEENPNVIVVATTNFPERVDDSLIRSGRFDIKLAIPPPGEGARAEIFTKMIHQLISAYETAGFRMFADDLDVPELARASTGMTGADIREVLRRAQLAKAMEETRTGRVATPIGQDELKRRIAEVLSGAR